MKKSKVVTVEVDLTGMLNRQPYGWSDLRIVLDMLRYVGLLHSNASVGKIRYSSNAVGSMAEISR